MIKRIIILLISLIVYFLDKLILFRNRCVVIYYHAILDEHLNLFKKQLDILIKHSCPISLDYDINTIKNSSKKLYTILTFDDGFQSVLNNAIPILEEKNIPAIIFIPTSYIGKHPVFLTIENSEISNEIIMTEDQIRNFKNSRIVEIGSHGMTHKPFTHYDNDEAVKELKNSKQQLEKLLKKEVRYFSFPHGAYEKRHITTAIKLGYKKVFSILPYTFDLSNNLPTIGRVSVNPTDWPIEFKLKIYGAFRWMATFSQLKRKILDATSGNKRFNTIGFTKE